MDDLLNDFLTETSEHIEAASSQLIQFEGDPTNSAILASIFRLVHTIKGTCGFLGLSRLEALTHAAEAVMSDLRDGAAATPALVTLILAAVDRIRVILSELEANGTEPRGDDADLIGALNVHRGDLEARTDDQPAIPSATVPNRPPVAAAPSSMGEGDAPVAGRTKRTESIRVDVTALERIMVPRFRVGADAQPAPRYQPQAGG